MTLPIGLPFLLPSYGVCPIDLGRWPLRGWRFSDLLELDPKWWGVLESSLRCAQMKGITCEMLNQYEASGYC